MGATWYYRQDGRETGPVSFEEVFELARSGTLSRSHSVRAGEDGTWVPAESIVGLFPDSPSAGPEPESLQELSSLDDLNFQLVSGSKDVPLARPSSAGEDYGTPEPATVPATDDAWYYRRGESELGPFSLQQIQQLAKAGAVDADDWVRKGNSGAWLRACKSPDLDGFVATVEPPTAAVPSSPPFEPEPAASEPAAVAAREDEPEAKVAEPVEDDEIASNGSDVDSLLDDADDEPDLPPPPPVPVERWFCRIEEVEHGPLTFKELQAIAGLDRLKRDDNVKNGDDGTWVPAATVPDLFTRPVTPSTASSEPFDAADTKPSRKRKPPKPKKVRTPREPLSLTLGEHKTVILSVVGVVAAAGLLYLGYTMIGGGRRSRQHIATYRQLDEIWVEHKSLRKRKAPAADWDDLIGRAKEVQGRIVPELTKGNAPAVQEMLVAARDNLIPMLEECRKKAGEPEQEFARHMEAARKLLGNPPAAQEDPAEDEPPPGNRRQNDDPVD